MRSPKGKKLWMTILVLATKHDSAEEHAQKAIALGVSKDKVKEMEVVVS